MQRRDLLGTAGAGLLSSVLLAGCTGGPTDSAGDEPETTNSADDTPTETTPTLTGATLSVTDVLGSPPDSHGSVDFRPETNTVVVTDVIQGSDGCKTAVLDDAAYDPEADELSVAVVTEDREDATDHMCTAALVYVDYEVTVEFEGGLPGSVTLSHDGQTVASGGYDTGTDG